MQIIKTTKQVENCELQRKFTLYLSDTEMLALFRLLLTSCVPAEFDEEDEECRKKVFGSIPENLQKILIFITDDISKQI